ncbi:MAG TPA: ubiquinol-cytochrome c reductase iron-sulfur subunit [Gemmataceae bacterium]|nr:ubiquinol-cytochrome c reductase iron-sulfur subunit [Gemmataceae bacterium]
MSDTDTTRRRFLSICTSLLLAVLGLLMAIPIFRYLWSPLRKRGGAEGAGPPFVDVGPLSDFPVGQWHLRALETVHEDGWRQTRVRHAIWVRRQGEGAQDIAVLSSICPHLGCPVNWHPDESRFVCPCHGGIFDPTGRRTSGPVPRAMDALEFEVRAGRLWVRWQDFRIGVAERVPVTT